jgi:hypothetical protein
LASPIAGVVANLRPLQFRAVKKGLAGEPEFAQPPAAGALEAGDFPGQEGELWELSQ